VATSFATLTLHEWKEYVTFTVTIIAMLNPLGKASIFLSMVQERSPSEQQRIAAKTSLSIAIILLIVIWCGDTILRFFGLNIGAVRIGGGLIVIMIGLRMLGFLGDNFGKTDYMVNDQSIAAVPLAIPIMAGPGTIAAALSEVHHTFNIWYQKVIISVIVLGITLFVWVVLRFASSIGRSLGPEGLSIVTKLMGLLLVAIASQMIMEGIIGILHL
jgi:MarC family membrane protein